MGWFCKKQKEVKPEFKKRSHKLYPVEVTENVGKAVIRLTFIDGTTFDMTTYGYGFTQGNDEGNDESDSQPLREPKTGHTILVLAKERAEYFVRDVYASQQTYVNDHKHPTKSVINIVRSAKIISVSDYMDTVKKYSLYDPLIYHFTCNNCGIRRE